MACSCKDLEIRMSVLEEQHKSIAELIGLLEDVKSALRVFVKIGNAFKWVAILISSIIGAIMAIRKWM